MVVELGAYASGAHGTTGLGWIVQRQLNGAVKGGSPKRGVKSDFCYMKNMFSFGRRAGAFLGAENGG